jgi:hypothetical protein
MFTMKRSIAAAELLLIFPGALFMAALFMRSAQPRQFEPSHSAQRLIDWFSVHPPISLHLFLMAMPFAALVIGCVTLLHAFSSDAEFRQMLTAARAQIATLLIAVATIVAGFILAVVAVHVITD